MPRKRPKGPLRRWVENTGSRLVTGLLCGAARVLSWRRAQALGRAAGWVLYALTPRRQRMADENLRAAFGDRFSAAERRRLRIEVCQGICQTALELFKLPSFSTEQMRSAMDLQHPEHLQAALERGHGAIIVTAHFGNWELLGARIVAEGFPLTVIVRDANDARTASIVNRSRRSAGVVVLPRDDLKGMLRALRRNEVLGIVADQHAPHGLWLEFMGREAGTPRGPATLALRAGAALVPCFSVREPDGRLAGWFEPPIVPEPSGDRDVDVRDLTQRLNWIIEGQIRRYPAQWLWLHDRWKPPQQSPKHVTA